MWLRGTTTRAVVALVVGAAEHLGECNDLFGSRRVSLKNRVPKSMFRPRMLAGVGPNPQEKRFRPGPLTLT